jgi:ribosome-binding factor A
LSLCHSLGSLANWPREAGLSLSADIFRISLPAQSLRPHHLFVRESMTLDKRTRDKMLAHCGEVNDDDGVDPREYFKTPRSRKQEDRKARQLCAQVAQTLSLVLAGEFHDELLHNLQVVSVKPAPDATQLAVAVRADVPGTLVDPCEVLDRLNGVSGRLRTEVAAAITRKRAPKLVFQVIATADDSEERQ